MNRRIGSDLGETGTASYLSQRLSSIYQNQNHLQACKNIVYMDPTSKTSGSVHLEWGLRISNKFPGDAGSAGSRRIHSKKPGGRLWQEESI